MKKATELFENTIEWLKENYGNFIFFLERNLVWTVQKHIIELIKKNNLPFKIFNYYPILPGKRRHLCTDLAILSLNKTLEIAVEFKYEPSHYRDDILQSKLPVVFWGKDGVGKDIKRIKEYIDKGKAEITYLVFIDEGGHFRHKYPHPFSKWIDWEIEGPKFNKISVLWSKIEKG